MRPGLSDRSSAGPPALEPRVAKRPGLRGIDSRGPGIRPRGSPERACTATPSFARCRRPRKFRPVPSSPSRSRQTRRGETTPCHVSDRVLAADHVAARGAKWSPRRDDRSLRRDEAAGRWIAMASDDRPESPALPWSEHLAAPPALPALRGGCCTNPSEMWCTNWSADHTCDTRRK